MSNTTINALTSASTIDAVNDLLPIYQNSTVSTLAINRNTLLGIASAPAGLTDSQTLTNKTLTSPTINGATLSGTLSGTYTIGGTPTFPSTVVQTTSTQTLTNKTLTSPTINSPTITNATISSDAITGYTTSNAGTIYGISVSSGAFSTSNIITNTNITTGNLYTSKVYNPYKFSAYQSSSQSLTASTQTMVNFQTVLFDTSSNFSTSTNKFTAPVAGFYQFNIMVNFTTGSSTSYAAVYLYQNSTDIAVVNFGTSSAQNNPGSAISKLVQLSVGDTLNVQAILAASGSVQSGQNNTYFSGYLVSAT